MTNDNGLPVRMKPVRMKPPEESTFSPMLLSHCDSSWNSPSPLRNDEEARCIHPPARIDAPALVRLMTHAFNNPGIPIVDRNIPESITLPAPRPNFRLNFTDCDDCEEDEKKVFEEDEKTVWNSPIVPERVQSIVTQPTEKKRKEDEDEDEDDRKQAAVSDQASEKKRKDEEYEEEDDRKPAAVGSAKMTKISGQEEEKSVGVEEHATAGGGGMTINNGAETKMKPDKKRAKNSGKLVQQTMDWRLTTTMPIPNVSPELTPLDTSVNADLQRAVQIELDQKLAEMIYMEELSNYHNRNLPK